MASMCCKFNLHKSCIWVQTTREWGRGWLLGSTCPAACRMEAGPSVRQGSLLVYGYSTVLWEAAEGCGGQWGSSAGMYPAVFPMIKNFQREGFCANSFSDLQNNPEHMAKKLQFVFREPDFQGGGLPVITERVWTWGSLAEHDRVSTPPLVLRTCASEGKIPPYPQA